MDISPLKPVINSKDDDKSQESSSEDEDFLEIATDKEFPALTPGDSNV